MKPSNPSEEDWAGLQRRHRRGYVYRMLAGVAATGVAAWLVANYGNPPTQSEIDVQRLLAPKTAQPFRPAYPVNRKLLSSIDMARVHRQLFPSWIISLQHKPHSIGHADAEQAFAALRSEAGKDPNLGVLLDRLHEHVMDGTYDLRGEVQALVQGWNDYLAESRVPFHLEYRISRTYRGPEHRVVCYRVVADIPVSTQPSAEQRVLLLARQDHTNLVEGFLGRTLPDSGTALVVTDRIAEYAIERLWPLFDSESAPSTHELLDKVRGEAQEALGESTLDTLARTLSKRRRLEAELKMLSLRRGCGAGILIDHVPWNGLSDRALALVNRVARKNDRRGCPRVTLGDADNISTLSQQLSTDAELVRALGALAGWVTGVAVAHEARHLADEGNDMRAAGASFCPGCPASFDYVTRTEISAYLASFATPRAGYVALHQACDYASDRGGAHSAALKFLIPKLLAQGCEGPIPEELHSRAASVDAELFARTHSVRLPPPVPTVVPLPVD